MIQLEVFAYWETLPDGNHNRYGTILQSGGDPTIIGNVVLKNPGSASPVSEENDSLFGREDGRLQFSPDATMYALADLFMLDKKTGTIRLYNLIDFRDTVPEQALRASTVSMDKVAEEILNGPPVPTYIGWGNLWQKKELTSRAKDIFQAALPHSSYLIPDISKNEFIHPLYLMRYGANDPRCKSLIAEFRKTLKP